MRNMRKCLVWILLLVLACGMLSACSKKNSLVGTWISEDPDFNGVEMMTLKADGTGMVDGFSINWVYEDGEFKFSWLLGTQTYQCKIEGDVLYMDDYKFNRSK